MVLVAAMGCGQKSLPQRETPVVPPSALESPLASLRGDYRLLDVDGETVGSGRLSVVEGEAGVGVTYAASLSGSTYGRKILSPRAKTEVTPIEGGVHQKYQEGEDKLTVDYVLSDSTLSVEVIECHPGSCLSTVLSAAKE